MGSLSIQSPRHELSYYRKPHMLEGCTKALDSAADPATAGCASGAHGFEPGQRVAGAQGMGGTCASSCLASSIAASRASSAPASAGASEALGSGAACTGAAGTHEAMRVLNDA